MDSSMTGIAVSTAHEFRLAPEPSWLSALLEALRRHTERRAGARRARYTLNSLRHLDARTLHDIGLDASELQSVSLEVAGLIEATRGTRGSSALTASRRTVVSAARPSDLLLSCASSHPESQP